MRPVSQLSSLSFQERGKGEFHLLITSRLLRDSWAVVMGKKALTHIWHNLSQKAEANRFPFWSAAPMAEESHPPSKLTGNWLCLNAASPLLHLPVPLAPSYMVAMGTQIPIPVPKQL